MTVTDRRRDKYRTHFNKVLLYIKLEKPFEERKNQYTTKNFLKMAETRVGY